MKTLPRILISLIISIAIFFILSFLFGLLGSSEMVTACLLATVPVNTILLFIGFTLSQQMDEIRTMLNKHDSSDKTDEQ